MRKWVLFFLLWPSLLWATPDLSGLPLLHEGRVKPFDTVARIYLQDIYGQEEFQDIPAHAWLTQLMLEPGTMLEQPMIRIGQPQVRESLKLPERQPPIYTYGEVQAPLQQQKALLTQLGTKDRNQMTATELGMWQAYLAVDRLTQFTATLSLLLPHAEGSFLTQFPEMQALRQRLQTLVNEKGDDVAMYSEEEQSFALRVFRLDTLQAIGQDNHLLRLIPLDWSAEWVSPWELVLSGQTSPRSGAVLQDWRELVQAYYAKGNITQTAETLIADTYAASDASPWRIQMEMLMNQLHLIPLLAALYALFVIVGIVSYARAKPHWLRWAERLLLFPLIVHTLLIAQRVLLLGRPPVGTLYESVLFVGLIAGWFGWWLARRRVMPESALIGGGLAGLLLAVSGYYAGQGDTMTMLVAVLNTQFWLATHVICITIGYGTALVAGSIAHLALWRPALPVAKMLPTTAAIALLFTTIGTILGGIWADQSWGRFWGWDPKENGALLIVLWLAWVLHARMTHYVGVYGFAALLALTNVVVALSWFGVNLLNVGLHSYGFTDAAATGLYVFCAAELFLIGGLYAAKRGNPHVA